MTQSRRFAIASGQGGWHTIDSLTFWTRSGQASGRLGGSGDGTYQMVPTSTCDTVDHAGQGLCLDSHDVRRATGQKRQ